MDLAQALIFEFDVGWWHRHDVEIVLVIPPPFSDTVANQHFQRDIDVQVFGAKGAEQARHAVVGLAGQHLSACGPRGERVALIRTVLGVTFPLNKRFGIPLYTLVAQHLKK